jgi:hypothetical protein
MVNPSLPFSWPPAPLYPTLAASKRHYPWKFAHIGDVQSGLPYDPIRLGYD